MAILTDLLDPETMREILRNNEGLVAPLPGIVVDETVATTTPVATRPDLQPGERAPAPQPPEETPDRGFLGATPIATRPDLLPGEAAPATTTPVATRPDLQPGQRAPERDIIPVPDWLRKGTDIVAGWLESLRSPPEGYWKSAYAQAGLGPTWGLDIDLISEERATPDPEKTIWRVLAEQYSQAGQSPWVVDEYPEKPEGYWSIPALATPPTGSQTYDAWGRLGDYIPEEQRTLEENRGIGVPRENIPMVPTIEDEMYYPMSVPAHRQEPFILGDVVYPAYWNTGVYDETQRNIFGTLDKPFGPYPPGEEPPEITDIEDYDTRWSKYDVLLEMNGVNPEDPDEVNAFLQYVDPVTMLDMMNEGYIQEVEGLSEVPEGTGRYGGYNRGGYYSPGGYYPRSSERDDYPARVGLVSWRI